MSPAEQIQVCFVVGNVGKLKNDSSKTHFYGNLNKHLLAGGRVGCLINVEGTS